jgi:type I restriction enzyme M protein
MSYNLKSIKKQFKENGIFYTPPELAEMVKTYVKQKPESVYDPTCGDGGLLAVFGDDVPKFGQEINHPQLEVAQNRLVNFTGYAGDTLSCDGFVGKKFDCIVANPPFSIKWTPNETDDRFLAAPCVPTASRADYAFIMHILHHLADHGIAAILSFPGVLYRGNREQTLRKWLVELGVISRIVAIPSDTFVDTAIATAIIVIDKQHHGESIDFEDKETGIVKTVSKIAIADNDYNLSVSSYIQKEITKQIIKPKELERDARKQMLNKLRADIDMSKMVCEIDGFNFSSYLDDIQKVINEQRKQLQKSLL